MKVLLDTHAFLWLISGDDRLSETAQKAFLNPGNILFFSAASLWEICIKIVRKTSIEIGKSLKKGLQTAHIACEPILSR